ncbi:MAG: DUF2459 domain-containing protein, partial [candidate division NC10 bacterium]|nr:DUF2459 domain-containing protein [candidate division NC10 bacterium]
MPSVGLILIAAVLIASGCRGPIASLYPPAAPERTKTVWVVDHGWHTGLVVRRADIPEAIWPEHRDVPGSTFLEVAWGNRDFYIAEHPTLAMALKAAFVPTESVLHVAGFSQPPAEYFPAADEILVLDVSLRGFEELVRFVHEEYARDAEGRVIKLAPGQYPGSTFYLARGTYHLLNTCNTWVARALRAAGLPTTPAYAITAGNVMFQLRPLGRVVGPAAGRLWRPCGRDRIQARSDEASGSRVACGGAGRLSVRADHLLHAGVAGLEGVLA